MYLLISHATTRRDQRVKQWSVQGPLESSLYVHFWTIAKTKAKRIRNWSTIILTLFCPWKSPFLAHNSLMSNRCFFWAVIWKWRSNLIWGSYPLNYFELGACPLNTSLFKKDCSSTLELTLPIFRKTAPFNIHSMSSYCVIKYIMKTENVCAILDEKN